MNVLNRALAQGGSFTQQLSRGKRAWTGSATFWVRCYAHQKAMRLKSRQGIRGTAWNTSVLGSSTAPWRSPPAHSLLQEMRGRCAGEQSAGDAQKMSGRSSEYLPGWPLWKLACADTVADTVYATARLGLHRNYRHSSTIVYDLHLLYLLCTICTAVVLVSSSSGDVCLRLRPYRKNTTVLR